jgi:RNA polymerase sigma-70 factor (ECF subfamily)
MRDLLAPGRWLRLVRASTMARAAQETNESSVPLRRLVRVNHQRSTLTGARTMVAGGTMRDSVAADQRAASTTDVQRADAFRRLVDGHLDDSYRLASAILGDPTDARDAVHDAFVTGWQRWPSLRETDRFGSWFKRIVVNTCKDRLRKAARRRSEPLGERPVAIQPDPARSVHDRLVIEDGLRRLKPDDRIILALRYYRDLKIEHIAEVLGIPPGTATSRLRNAHIHLRRVIERSASQEVSR